MPRIGPAEVRRLAQLAGLRLGDGEADRLAAELAGILAHFEALRSVQAEAPEPGEPSRGAPRSPLREDIPASDPLVRPPSASAPAWRDGFFLVPRLPGMEDPAR